MADINFFEPEGKEPEKSGHGVILAIVFFLAVIVAVAYISMRKTLEYTQLEQKKNEMVQFIDSPDTKSQLNKYYQVQADITKIRNENMPIMQAYVDYKIMNTATASLIKDNVWAPIDDHTDTMQFKSLTVAGNNVIVVLCVNDVEVMRQYQTALIGMKINVDKDYIDKLPDAPTATDGTDMEIDKFTDQFTTQIITQLDPNFDPPYEGTLTIQINKDITKDMYSMLGGGK